MAERFQVSQGFAEEFPGTTKGVLLNRLIEETRKHHFMLEELGVPRRDLISLDFFLRVRADLGLENFNTGDDGALNSLEEVSKKINCMEHDILNKTGAQVRDEVLRNLISYSRSREAREAFESAENNEEILYSYRKYAQAPITSKE